MGACHFCHAPFEDQVDFHTTCPTCGKPLHSCVNCVSYEPGAYHDCHDGVDEEELDKEAENFCEWFRLGSGGGSKPNDAKAARAKAEALFTF